MTNDINELKAVALQMIGQQTNETVQAAVEEIAPPRKIIPFVETKDPILHLTLGNVTLRAEDKVNPYIRDIDFYFDQRTGQIIKIKSRWPDHAPGEPFPDIAREEDQMMRAGTQCFVAVPEKTPEFALNQVLEARNAYTAMIAHVLAPAKQMVVYYAITGYGERKQNGHALWVIHCWGSIPFIPIGGRPGDVAERLRNHYRFKVDANTGDVYGWDNVPQARQPSHADAGKK